MGLLSGGDGGIAREFASQKLYGLLVAERSEGAGGVAILIPEALSFFDQSVIKHANRALVDAGIKRFPVGHKAEAQHAKTGKRVAPLLPHLGHLGACGEADFNGTD